MREIQKKYQKSRPLLQNGDVILFSGKGLLAKIIQFFTKGKFNHVGIVWTAMGRVFIIDSNAPGVHPDFLSCRINTYQDFEVVRFNRPSGEKQAALSWLMAKSMEGTGIRYNFLRLLRIAVKDSTGVDLKWLDQSGHDICSQFVQLYSDKLEIKCFEDLPLITPMDYDYKLDWSEGQILFR